MEIFTDTPREFSLDKFVFRMIQSRQGKQFLLPKFHIDRTMESGETAQAAPKGNAEALRQKDRFRTILRKGRTVTPDHRRCNLPPGRESLR